MAQAPEPRDYSHELKLSRSRLTRFWLLGAGHACRGPGGAGRVPSPPSHDPVPAAGRRLLRARLRPFYNWLLNTRTFGPMIINWRDHRAIAPRHKLMAIGFIAVSIGTTLVFFMPHPAGQVALSGLGMGWIVVLLRLPTR